MKKTLIALMTAALVLLCMVSIPIALALNESAIPAPIAWYTFDDAANLGADSSGNGNNLTAKGNVASLTAGKSGKGVYLDGASALIASTDTETGEDFLDALQGTTGQFTLTYWFQATKKDVAGFNPATDWRRIVSNGMDFSGLGGFTVINNPNDPSNPAVLYSNPFVEYDNGYFAGSQFSANTPFSEAWMFAAVSVDTTTNTVKYYVNGVLLSVITPDLTDNGLTSGATGMDFSRPGVPLAFGAHYYYDGEGDHFTQAYKGALDDIRVFDTILNVEQIDFYMSRAYDLPEDSSTSSSSTPSTTVPDSPTSSETSSSTTVPDSSTSSETSSTVTSDTTRPGMEFDSRYPTPLAWYTFDDASNLGRDYSGNNHDLIAKGDPSSLAMGKNGKGLYLNGESALIASMDADNGGADFVDKLQDTTGQFTLTYWTKVTKADIVGFDPNTAWRRIFSNGFCFSGIGGFAFLDNQENGVNPSIVYSNPLVEYNNGHWTWMPFDVSTPFTEKWTFRAVTVDTKTNTLNYYLDGSLISTLTPDLTDGGKTSGASGLKFACPEVPFAIGAHYYNDGKDDHFDQSFKGALDQVGLFDKVLTDEEITYFMNYRGQTPPNTGDNFFVWPAIVLLLSIVGIAILCIRKPKNKVY